MMHLIQEYSVEVILSIIEMDQLQRSVLKAVQRSKTKRKSNSVGAGSSTPQSTADLAVSMPGTDTPTGTGAEGTEEQVWLKQLDWTVELGFISLAPSIPRSTIVCAELSAKYREVLAEYADQEAMQRLVEFKIRAYELFEKYVAVGYPYEINIASRTRSKLEQTMANFDAFVMSQVAQSGYIDGDVQDAGIEEELLRVFQLFSKPLAEMYLLLTYSFTRFKSNPAYDRLSEIMQK